MGLSWQAERDQAESMQRESDRRSAALRTQEAVKQGVLEALADLDLTPEQRQQLRQKAGITKTESLQTIAETYRARKLRGGLL